MLVVLVRVVYIVVVVRLRVTTAIPSGGQGGETGVFHGGISKAGMGCIFVRWWCYW